MLDRADCADFGCHNSIRLETKHFLNTLALTFISFSGRFVFAMQKHYLFFCERSSSCVSNVVGLKDSVIVSDKMEGLNPPPVTDQKNSKVTFNVDSHVANAHIVTGLPQRKGVNPTFCQLYTEMFLV